MFCTWAINDHSYSRASFQPFHFNLDMSDRTYSVKSLGSSICLFSPPPWPLTSCPDTPGALYYLVEGIRNLKCTHNYHDMLRWWHRKLQAQNNKLQKKKKDVWCKNSTSAHRVREAVCVTRQFGFNCCLKGSLFMRSSGKECFFWDLLAWNGLKYTDRCF